MANRKEEELHRDKALKRFGGSGEAPPDADMANGTADQIAKHFVDLPQGQLLVRYIGDRNKPPVLILHDAPGSGFSVEPLMRHLVREDFSKERFSVYAFDLPGCGDSDPLLDHQPTIQDYADAVKLVCSKLQLDRINLHGVGIGASVAIEVTARHPNLVQRLALQSVLLLSDEEREELRQKYAPPIKLSASGSHWYATWLMLRDSLSLWPWYNRSRNGLRRAKLDLAFNLNAEHLHRWTVEVMKQYHSYHHVIKAVLSQNSGARLASLGVPCLVCVDRNHPFNAYDRELSELLNEPHRYVLSGGNADFADRLARFYT